MTTILISVLSGILGLMIGFAIGMNSGADCAYTFGKWKVCRWKGVFNNNKYFISGKNDDKCCFILELDKNGDVDFYGTKLKPYVTK